MYQRLSSFCPLLTISFTTNNEKIKGFQSVWFISWCTPMCEFLLTFADVYIFLPVCWSDSQTVQLYFLLFSAQGVLTAWPPKGQFLPRKHMILPPFCSLISPSFLSLSLHLLLVGKSHSATPSHYYLSHPPCSDLWWPLLRPTKPQNTASTCSENWLWTVIAERIFPISPFWLRHSIFTFPPSSIMSKKCCLGRSG